MNDADQVRLATDANAFWEYCRQLTAKRIAEPGDDCLSALLAYRAGDDAVLTEGEVASFAFDLLAAGHETTSNLLSNGLLQLLTGGAWEELLAHPSRIPAAVEEILRYDPPLLGWLRVTTRPCLVGDVEIPAGQRVMLLLGSANHDERRREDADRFDIGRVDAADHLSFGLGRHFCPGAAVARLEAKVALEVLVECLPGLRLRAGFEPRYQPSCGFRLLESLPVVWDAAR